MDIKHEGGKKKEFRGQTTTECRKRFLGGQKDGTRRNGICDQGSDNLKIVCFLVSYLQTTCTKKNREFAYHCAEVD